MAFVVGGGDSSPDLYRFLPRCPHPARSLPSKKLGAMASWWWSSSSASPLSYSGALVAGGIEGDPFPALWFWANSSLCSYLAKAIGPALTPSGGAAAPFSGGFLVAGSLFSSMGCVWFGWFGRDLGTVVIKTRAKPARIVWMWVFSPELVPVMYCICILIVFWTTGVGSGWCSILLLISTGVGSGLLLDYSQCLVACFVVPHGRSLGWCLSSTPRGVFFIVPSGAFKPLTLVSTQDNSRWAPYHDDPILGVYIITVSAVVFLTLTTFHHIV